MHWVFPLIGICDTNCDPEELDYVIPGNDDAIRAVKTDRFKMADAVIEAKQGTADEKKSKQKLKRTKHRRIIFNQFQEKAKIQSAIYTGENEMVKELRK